MNCYSTAIFEKRSQCFLWCQPPPPFSSSPPFFWKGPTNLTSKHQKITEIGIILVDIGEFAIACLHYRKHYRNYVFYMWFLRRKNRLPSGRSTDHALANLLMALSQISVFCAAANNKRSDRSPRNICRPAEDTTSSQAAKPPVASREASSGAIARRCARQSREIGIILVDIGEFTIASPDYRKCYK